MWQIFVVVEIVDDVCWEIYMELQVFQLEFILRVNVYNLLEYKCGSYGRMSKIFSMCEIVQLSIKCILDFRVFFDK